MTQEDKPFTTAALREFEKAKGEKVYSKVVVKVKLPEGVTLQGYFHPRSLLIDVYSWVGTCLTPIIEQFGVMEPLTSPVSNVANFYTEISRAFQLVNPRYFLLHVTFYITFVY